MVMVAVMNKEDADIWMDEKGSRLLNESYFQAETKLPKTCLDVLESLTLSCLVTTGGGNRWLITRPHAKKKL